MHDGRHVAVKVQRPGLKATISKDIAALTYLVALGEKLFPHLRALDLPVVVHEFANSLNREIDFSREARSIVLFRAALADVPDVWIPDVVAEYSRRTVLTMEYSAGERVDLYARLHPEAMPQAIDTLVKLMLQSIFEEGLFHADPHPGNIFVLPDGRLSLLDFGMTGDLDEPMRESLYSCSKRSSKAMRGPPPRLISKWRRPAKKSTVRRCWWTSRPRSMKSTRAAWRMFQLGMRSNRRLHAGNPERGTQSRRVFPADARFRHPGIPGERTRPAA
jgi:hypothetical protein